MLPKLPEVLKNAKAVIEKEIEEIKKEESQPSGLLTSLVLDEDVPEP